MPNLVQPPLHLHLPTPRGLSGSIILAPSSVHTHALRAFPDVLSRIQLLLCGRRPPSSRGLQTSTFDHSFQAMASRLASPRVQTRWRFRTARITTTLVLALAIHSWTVIFPRRLSMVLPRPSSGRGAIACRARQSAMQPPPACRTQRLHRADAPEAEPQQIVRSAIELVCRSTHL